MELSQVETPVYVVDKARLEANCRLLAEVQERAGCNILVALKGFAMWSLFPVMRKYLKGVTASGIHEALLGREEFGGEIHVHSPAFTRRELERLLPVADHISFNSPAQLQLYRDVRAAAQGPAARRKIDLSIRVNPEYSEVETDIYNPCAPGSRLGCRLQNLKGADLTGITGLHFHTLCEQNSDTLERTLPHVEKHFGWLLERVKWVNMGGGHHITREDYDVDRLVRIIRDFAAKWDVCVYLEPGEAIALNTGVLIASVVDVIPGAPTVAIIDASATAHMPDVLEMPYRPEIAGAAEPGKLGHTYRIGGPTCLAGDIVGDYSFPHPLKPGDRLVFRDMAHYTMVKNTTFNGVPLPAIAIWHPEQDRLQTVRRFGYEDYKMRLS